MNFATASAEAATVATSGQSKRPPLLLTLAQERLHMLFSDSAVAYCGKRVRHMRPERIASTCALLRAMLRAACIQHRGAPCQVHGREARPLTAAELAKRAGLSERTAKRCLADLRAAGILEKRPQIKRRNSLGMVAVAPVLRTFSEYFWRRLSLWEHYVSAANYAASQPPIKIRMPMRRIDHAGRVLRMAARPPRQEAVPMDIQVKALLCREQHPDCNAPAGDPRVCRVCLEGRNAP